MRRHRERHVGDRVGWLRAAVLGANDGILSTAGLVVGVASADATLGSVMVAGVAGLVAGALSMATGEYVSVSSQSDAEKAERELEQHELAIDAHGEREELVNIYVGRGLDRPLAEQVAGTIRSLDIRKLVEALLRRASRLPRGLVSELRKLKAYLRDNIGLIETLCSRAVLLREGTVASQGAIQNVVADYLASSELPDSGDLLHLPRHNGTNVAKLAREL